MVKNIIKSRNDREMKTIETMIQAYCKNFHNPENKFCQFCLELLEYSEKRLKHCQFGENKPTCKNCPIHCYKPDKREDIRKVMRYAGPRMLYSHPFMGVRHLLNKFKK